MTRPFRRARNPEQKEERRTQVLDAARALLDGGADLRALSLNEIARHAGMAKANVYRYFESREAVLLALLWNAWEAWFDAFRAGVPRRRVATLDGLMTRLARSLAREPLLCALIAALPSVLEQNLSEEAIRAFKLESLASFHEMAAFLEKCCPELPASSYAELVHDASSAIIGLYPSTHPAPAAARVISAPDLRFFQRDFGEELGRFLRALAAARRASDATSAGVGPS